jgi:hypothetical protein
MASAAFSIDGAALGGRFDGLGRSVRLGGFDDPKHSVGRAR